MLVPGTMSSCTVFQIAFNISLFFKAFVICFILLEVTHKSQVLRHFFVLLSGSLGQGWMELFTFNSEVRLTDALVNSLYNVVLLKHSLLNWWTFRHIEYIEIKSNKKILCINWRQSNVEGTIWPYLKGHNAIYSGIIYSFLVLNKLTLGLDIFGQQPLLFLIDQAFRM